MLAALQSFAFFCHVLHGFDDLSVMKYSLLFSLAVAGSLFAGEPVAMT